VVAAGQQAKPSPCLHHLCKADATLLIVRGLAFLICQQQLAATAHVLLVVNWGAAHTLSALRAVLVREGVHVPALRAVPADALQEELADFSCRAGCTRDETGTKLRARAVSEAGGAAAAAEQIEARGATAKSERQRGRRSGSV